MRLSSILSIVMIVICSISICDFGERVGLGSRF